MPLSPENPYGGSTLILMVGLPYAGKTTWAWRLESQLDSATIVCPDAVRIALHGQRFVPEAEHIVWPLVRAQVRSAFAYGYHHVILDATNISRKRRDEWRDGPEDWDVFLCPVRTSPDVCRVRASDAGDTAIQPVITRMWQQHDPPQNDELLLDAYGDFQALP